MPPKVITSPPRSPAGTAGQRSSPTGNISDNERRQSLEALEPQIVKIVLPDGEEEVRLAAVDQRSGVLQLHQVSVDEESEEVVLGGMASIKLASIGAVDKRSNALHLRAGGSSGKVLLEIVFDDAPTASAWASMLSPAGSGNSRTPTSSASPSAGAAAMLKELVGQQEQQASLLERLTERKNEQLLKLQGHLEEVLQKLQLGQQTYAKQQCVLQDQQRSIETHLSQLQAADLVETACATNRAAAAAGAAAAAAARAGARGPLAVQAMAAHSAFDQDDDPQDDDPEEMPEAEALLAKLQGLQAEKSAFQAQLAELQGMMQALGLSGLEGLEGLGGLGGL